MITGAAGGIGRATAELFIAEGARVVMTDLDGEALAVAARPFGGAAVWVAGDIAEAATAERAVAAAKQHFGGLHVLFANAGTEGRIAPLVQQRAEDLERVLRINVLGVFHCIQRAAPLLAESGGGSIVITSSVAGVIGSAGLGPYVASKHVNTVNPGPVENRMMRSIEEQAAPGHGDVVKAGFLKQVPLGRYATNEEISRMVLFLASDDSSYCTGSVYMADGGFVAM